MMKVLLLNGSANKNGNTFTALSEIARQLEKNGVESEIMQLGNKPVRGYIACGQCQAKQLGHCVFDDDICNRIVEKLNEADAPNGAVLAVLQRAFFSGAQVQNKPAAAVAICRRGGATAAFQTMNMIFEMKNMPVVTSQYWNIAYGLAPGEATQDTEGMQTMRTLANNMAWLLKKIHANDNPDYPEREEWQGMNFIR